MKKRWSWLHIFQLDEFPQGFILAEILIAVTIFSVILTVIYGSFASTTRSIRISSEKSDIYQIARVGLERMARDISCAFPPKNPSPVDMEFKFKGEDGEREGMPWDTLNFISTSHLKFVQGLNDSGLYEIGYFIETDPETEEMVLFRREDSTIDDEIDKGGVIFEMTERIKGLDFKYYDDEGGEWEDWDSDNKEYLLPRTVKITLTLEDESKKKLEVATKVYLEMSR